MQSRLLILSVGATLVAACLPLLLLMIHPGNGGYFALRAGIVSLTFAVAVWVLRAATPAAALCGGMICLLVTFGTEGAAYHPEVHSGLAPLMVLFFLTFLATRAGRSRKVQAALAEPRGGRNAAQVVANLGIAGIIGAAIYLGRVGQESVGVAVLVGVLAEAAADTVSSEIGQAFGGTPFSLLGFERVKAGTDGAVSLLGTVAGLGAAALVVLAASGSMNLSAKAALAGWLGGAAGLVFDSLLGATAERRGWLGNDLVNFSSTVFAGLTTLLLMKL